MIFENFNFKTFLGKISWVELKDNVKLADDVPVTILEKKTHLSYPSIFNHAGRTYMLPEEISSKEIALHELDTDDLSIKERFVLLSGKHYVDPSLFHHDNKFWIFCGIYDVYTHGSSKLHIFYSDHLKGPYLPHRANPVVADLKTARPAGSIFTFNENIYRPSQNCLGRYGRELNIFRIEKLNEKEYEEQLVKVIKPDSKYNMGAHHLAVFENKIIIDGRREWFSIRSFYWKLKHHLFGEPIT